MLKQLQKVEYIKHIHDNDHLIKTTWCMSIDLDEFVYSRLGFDKITDYLQSLETTENGRKTEQIWLYWKMFGSNSMMKQPRSVIGGFTKRQSFLNCAGNGKTMYRTREIEGQRPRRQNSKIKIVDTPKFIMVKHATIGFFFIAQIFHLDFNFCSVDGSVHPIFYRFQRAC